MSEAVAARLPDAKAPPLTVVPSEVEVPYSKYGFVDLLPASMLPLNVALVAPIAVGAFVRIEIVPTEVATFAAVKYVELPPLIEMSSLAS